jgi:hypothetical protein
MEVSLNDQPMGSQIPAVADRQIDVRVEGQDSLSMVELVRGGRVIERYFPEDHAHAPLKLPGRVKCRVQFGWGPWANLNLARVCPWDMTLRITGGRFHRALACFQAVPFGEELRDRLRVVSDTELVLQAFTTREHCFAEDPTKSVICELEGGPDAVLSLELRQPSQQTTSARLADLLKDNLGDFTGAFTTESFIIGRLVGPSEYSAAIRWQDRAGKRTGPDWYYIRATQHNGHMAWSSPIWVG